nr:MAG TPA: hypothetical protein [Microviridae sp.]
MSNPKSTSSYSFIISATRSGGTTKKTARTTLR